MLAKLPNYLFYNKFAFCKPHLSGFVGANIALFFEI